MGCSNSNRASRRRLFPISRDALSLGLRRWRLRSAATLAAGLFACGIMDGGRPGSSALAVQKDRPKAWFDARSACIFPLLSGRLPHSSDELGLSLTGGYEAALRVPEGAKLVEIAGDAYPALDSIRINLSDAALPLKKKTDKEKAKPNNRSQGRLGVGYFELIGEPLLCDKARLNLQVTVADAHLDLEHDRRGKPILLLSDARAGEIEFAATQPDLERLLLINLRDAAEPYGLSIVRASLRIESSSPHSVTASVHVYTKLGPVPAGMLFRAHVDIDDAMNARLTGLTCEGDEALGPLIVGFLRPGLAKYEGKSRPIVSFPSAALRLRQVEIKVDEAVHLHVAFGSAPS